MLQKIGMNLFLIPDLIPFIMVFCFLGFFFSVCVQTAGKQTYSFKWRTKIQKFIRPGFSAKEFIGKPALNLLPHPATHYSLHSQTITYEQ